jgi:hypothetical protein
MHFHYGLGVSHIYSHEERACPITQLPAWIENEPLESGEMFSEHMHWQGPANDDVNDKHDNNRYHVGTEELYFFDQGLNASTELLTQVLVKMFTTSHTFDYEN